MDKDELFKLNSEITDLEIKLAKLKSKRKQLKDNIDYLVGCCLNRSKFYYKVLSINKEEQTVEALCVTYEEDEENLYLQNECNRLVWKYNCLIDKYNDLSEKYSAEPFDTLC